MLNQKDDEILRLSQKLISLEDQVRSQSPNKKKGGPGGLSPKPYSPKIEQGIKGKYGAISDMENRLMDAERQNKELQKEIKLLQRIQDR